MIILVGESASGKSTVEKILNKSFGYKKIVSYTTRQPREREVNGVNYFFVDDENFKTLRESGFFAETATYNGWYYGTPINQCTDNSILVATPYGLRQLKKNKNLNITSFYINVPRRDRLIKILQRGDSIEESYRRSLSDVGQYDGIESEVDSIIDNQGYMKSPEKIAREIYRILMRDKGIYLAGAMETYEEKTDKAKEWRELCKEWFKIYCDNFKAISPPDYYEYGANYHKTDAEVFKFDLRKVREADVILVNLSDIRKSIGTCMELKEANTYDIPVIGFLDEELPVEEMVQLIHPWVYYCCDRIETGVNSMELAMAYIRNYYN